MNGWITLLCLIWGSNWIAMKEAIGFFPPIMFSAIRFLIGTVVLLLIVYARKLPLPRREDWKWYGLCGILQTGLVFGVNQPALMYVPSGIVCVLGFTMPFWLCILAHFLIPGERITVYKGIGLFVGIVGLCFVLNINPAHLQGSGMQLLFEGLVLAGSVGWAVSNIIIKKKLSHHDKFQFTAYQMAIGTIGLFIATFIVERGESVAWNIKSVSSVFFAGVVASALANVLWFFILSKVDAGKASITLLMVPVVGVLCVWMVFGEKLDLHTLVGMLLVISGIALVNRKKVLSKDRMEEGKFAG